MGFRQPLTSSAVGNVAVGGVPHQMVPNHVAVIMDGNGRWASEKGLSRSEGHRAGTENIRRVLKHFAKYDVKYVTLFAFSTENWGRPDDEVSVLIELLWESIRRETQLLHEEGVRIRHIGRLNRLPLELQKEMRQSIESTKDNVGLTLSVAYDYGGRAEIVDAVRAIIADNVAPGDITEEIFQRYLYTGDLPDPDLVVRTAGEMRMSNFLLWQAAYAEYYSTSVLWPDFDEGEITRAMVAYGKRRRRYGGVDSAEQ